MEDPPRIHANGVHLAAAAYDVTITFLETDPTILPEGQEGPHASRTGAVAQIVLPWGSAKGLLPLLVKMIAEYESKFGEIPSPGFDEMSKE
jgi:hypothetical protein